MSKVNQTSQDNSYSLLLVDDEASVLNSLRRLFMDQNYNIFAATGGKEALEIMNREQIHLVITDNRMPEMPGSELLSRIKGNWPDTIRIMLTGHANIESVLEAVNQGAVYKFITKPWNDDDLLITVRNALQQAELVKENKSLRALTNKQQEKLQKYASILDDNRGVVGTYLLRAGQIDQQQLDGAHEAKLPNELLGDTFVRLGYATEDMILEAFRKNLNIKVADFTSLKPEPAIVRYLPRELCERNRLIPVSLSGKELTLAMADPSDILKCDNISMMTSLNVESMVAKSSEIIQLINDIYDGMDSDPYRDVEVLSDAEALGDIDIIIEEGEERQNLQELVSSSETPPIIRIVNAVLADAIRLKASDIHLEPKIHYTVVRYRVDGMLRNVVRVPSSMHPAIISRLKILGKLDIAERRVPQDGRISIRTTLGTMDIRLSTMPTLYGEKAVMRLLDKSSSIRTLEDLGVLGEDRDKVQLLVNRPQGMIISTGPTGSGKTTMLYAILNMMLQSTKNFQTIEDPVEYFLEEANQTYIHDKSGLSFPSVLRATLRQDPDVILVGEIRDFETADIAFKAALTGHMVLSSLHTNSSVASITRLIDMKVKPYLIASALEGILAQRLVRKICPHCREQKKPDPETLRLLNISVKDLDGKFYQGSGCDKCTGSGFTGRTGLYELFIMNDNFRHFISSQYKESELLKLARSGGMVSLLENGFEKVKAGLTTLDELLRVIGAQSRYERQCENCGLMIEATFMYCPHCSAKKHNFCTECMIPLEESWQSCPSCGQSKVE